MMMKGFQQLQIFSAIADTRIFGDGIARAKRQNSRKASKTYPSTKQQQQQQQKYVYRYKKYMCEYIQIRFD